VATGAHAKSKTSAQARSEDRHERMHGAHAGAELEEPVGNGLQFVSEHAKRVLADRSLQVRASSG
jgi:hypothetical protein